MDSPLSLYCEQRFDEIYKFNKKWYEGINENEIPFYTKKNKSKFIYKLLDISIKNIENICIVKKSLSYFYIKTSGCCSINEYPLEKDSLYKIELSMLDRASNKSKEYFMHKSLSHLIPDYEDDLKRSLKDIVDDNT